MVRTSSSAGVSPDSIAPITWAGTMRKRLRHQRCANMPPYTPTLSSDTPSVAHAHGNGRGLRWRSHPDQLALHVDQVGQQRVGLLELGQRRRIPSAEQQLDAGLPHRVELALARAHVGALQERPHVAGRDQEVEALQDDALRRERHEVHDADHRRVVADGRTTAVAVRGGGVGLHQVLADRVHLEAGDGAVGHRGLHPRRLVQQLVGEHDAGKAEDVHGVADLGVAGGQPDGRIDAVLHAKDREIATVVGSRLAVDVEAGRRAELLDLGLEQHAVREQHGELRERLDLGAVERAGAGLAADLVLEVGSLAAHQPLAPQRRLDAGLVDRLLLQLVHDPRRQAVRGIDHVGVRHQPPAAVHEPPGARLDERRRLHGDRPAAAVHRDLRVHARGDQGDRRLGEQDRLLHRQRVRGAGGERGRRDDDGTEERFPHVTTVSWSRDELHAARSRERA